MYASKYSLGDWLAVRSLRGRGHTVRAAAALSGVGKSTVWRWAAADEPPSSLGVPDMAGQTAAPAPRTARQRLSIEDRAWIAAMAGAGMGRGEIAERIGVHRTTVSRELRRCGGRYDPRAAHLDALRRARRPRPRKVESSARLRAYVLDGLARRWSPRQISERLAREFPDDEEMRMSHEAIYQAIYVQGRGSLRQELRLEEALRRGRSSRLPRSRLAAPRSPGRSWVSGCEISRRPAEAADRAVPGHWEGDLVLGSDRRSCLVTLVERKTRFLVARRLPTHETRNVVDLLIEMAASVPDAVRDGLLSTLTWDQGCEMADAARFTEATGFKVYFCDPHSPWQKGTNENTNGLVRQYFPKGTSFLDVTDEEVREMQDQLNGRPRETLGWRTPAEAVQSELAKANRAMTA